MAEFADEDERSPRVASACFSIQGCLRLSKAV